MQELHEYKAKAPFSNKACFTRCIAKAMSKPFANPFAYLSCPSFSHFCSPRRAARWGFWNDAQLRHVADADVDSSPAVASVLQDEFPH